MLPPITAPGATSGHSSAAPRVRTSSIGTPPRVVLPASPLPSPSRSTSARESGSHGEALSGRSHGGCSGDASAAVVASSSDARPQKPTGRVFSVSGGYPAIRQGLLDRGWQEGSPENPSLDFKWTCKRDEIVYSTLTAPQLANHFEKISHLCTKVGLNSHLQEARSTLKVDIDTFYPQSFHLFGAGELEAFATEYKLRKAEGVLKDWLEHREKDGAADKTFAEDVVNVALAVAQRHLADIDSLLVDEDNEAEVQGLSITDSEWAVLKEVDFANPAKDIIALELQRQAAVEHEHTKAQTRQAFERQVLELQKLTNRRLERISQKQQEVVRKEALRQRLRRSVLNIKGQELPTDGLAKTFGRSGVVLHQDKLACTSSLQPSAQHFGDSPSQIGSNSGCTIGASKTETVGGSALTWSSNGKPDAERMYGQRLLAEVRSVLDAWRRKSPQFTINGSRNVWILKPAGRSRGIGIFLSDNLDDILHCAKRARGTTTWVCQKYIEKPLLLSGRKHDLRQWVLVTSLNPLTIWFFGECYIRIAADQYVLDDIGDNLRHLTNNAIACHHPQFDAEDEYWQCMWDQAKYRAHLQREFGFDAFGKKVLPAMKQAVIATLLGTQEALSESVGSGCCFELLGYDFMVDAGLETWLLEVNTSPSMEHSTGITARLVPEALEDTLRVVFQDGPADAPTGRFELLYKGPAIPEDRSPNVSAAAGLLTVEGRRVRPPRPAVAETPGQDSAGAALQQRLLEKRAQELEALEEKKRRQREREQEQRDRKQRIRESLRCKVLRSSSLPGLQREATRTSEADPETMAEAPAMSETLVA